MPRPWMPTATATLITASRPAGSKPPSKPITATVSTTSSKLRRIYSGSETLQETLRLTTSQSWACEPRLPTKEE
jgi:hypothetical protein